MVYCQQQLLMLFVMRAEGRKAMHEEKLSLNFSSFSLASALDAEREKKRYCISFRRQTLCMEIVSNERAKKLFFSHFQLLSCSSFFDKWLTKPVVAIAINKYALIRFGSEGIITLQRRRRRQKKIFNDEITFFCYGNRAVYLYWFLWHSALVEFTTINQQQQIGHNFFSLTLFLILSVCQYGYRIYEKMQFFVKGIYIDGRG